MEISGRSADGSFLASYDELEEDGSTTCGSWIHCGIYKDGVNQSARKKPAHRAELDRPRVGLGVAEGHPHHLQPRLGRPGRQAVVRAQALRVVGRRGGQVDEPGRLAGLPADQGAGLRAGPRAPRRWRRSPATSRSSCTPTGAAGSTSPTGLVDGPLPAHYEPQETPFTNPLYAQQQNPTRQVFHRPENPYHPVDGEPGAEVFPFVLTTYRLTEHHTAGGMSRTVPYLAELQPEFFCEVSPELAAERGLEHGGWATIVTARQAVEARVLVTERIKPLSIQGRTMHLVGAPYHWGGVGIVTGDSANDLLPVALDNNVHISEYKAATCDIRPGPPAARAGPAAAGARSTGRSERGSRSGAVGRSSERAARDRGLAGQLRRARQAPHGLLHRHLGVHRLQGMRGGVQGVEPDPDVDRRASPASPTTTRSTSAPTRGGTWRSSSRSCPVDAREGASLVEVAARAGAVDGGVQTYQEGDGFRWLMASDVCKHCTHAACLEVCPTGALFRTEFGTVVVQEDVCNGCGYCVPACPFGVIDQREDDGRVWKCTLCYDRLKDDKEPACAQACPTNSIQFGELTELRERAEHRLAHLQHAGQEQGPAVPGRRGRRDRRRRRVLPAPRRARGLRAAARSGRHRRDLGSIWAAAGAAAVALGRRAGGGGVRRPSE